MFWLLKDMYLSAPRYTSRVSDGLMGALILSTTEGWLVVSIAFVVLSLPELCLLQIHQAQETCESFRTLGCFSCIADERCHGRRPTDTPLTSKILSFLEKLFPFSV